MLLLALFHTLAAKGLEQEGGGAGTERGRRWYRKARVIIVSCPNSTLSRGKGSGDH